MTNQEKLGTLGEEAAFVSAVGLGGHSRDHVAEAQSARSLKFWSNLSA
jgi:hypothetical protein